MLWRSARRPPSWATCPRSASCSTMWRRLGELFTYLISSWLLAYLELWFHLCRVSDPHWFNADPDTDPDPAFFLIADLDSGSGFRIRIPDPDRVFGDLKLEKIYNKKFNFYFWIKIAIYLTLGLHKGRPSYRRSLQPSKVNIQHFKRSRSATCMGIRIRIQELKLIRIRIRLRIRNPAFMHILSGKSWSESAESKSFPVCLIRIHTFLLLLGFNSFTLYKEKFYCVCLNHPSGSGLCYLIIMI